VNREVQQPALVDEVVLDEGLRKTAAAEYLQLAPGLGLQLAISATTSAPSSDELCQLTACRADRIVISFIRRMSLPWTILAAELIAAGRNNRWRTPTTCVVAR
jgi:hypothetical protein